MKGMEHSGAMKPNSLRLCLASVAGAVLLAALRLPLGDNLFITLFIKALLHPASLMHSSIIQAAHAAPYTFAPWVLARGLAWLSASANFPPTASIPCLQLIFWALQAALMYQLAEAATGDAWAACIAGLMFGTDIPLVWTDAAYTLQYLDRSLGTVPLLWGIIGLVQGRRWKALMGMSLAVYLHASPAIYVWPWMLIEDLAEAWRHPRARSGFALRILLASAVALPLVIAVLSEHHRGQTAEYMRITVAMFAPWIGGAQMANTDRIFIAEGMLLIALAAWRQKHIPAAPVLHRAMALCAAMLICGSIAYGAYAPDAFIWRLLVRAQLWIGSYLIQLAGHIFIASWLAAQMRRGHAAWPAFLCVLYLSAFRDYFLRAGGILLLLASGNGLWTVLAALATAGISFAAKGFPNLLAVFLHFFRLHGNFLSLPAFDPRIGTALLLCLLIGFLLNRRAGILRRSDKAPVAVAVGLFLVMGFAGYSLSRSPERPEGNQAADWLREHVPEDAVILVTPLNLLDVSCIDFMARAERAVYACVADFGGVMMFGAEGIPMEQRLDALGMDLQHVRGYDDYVVEMRKADEHLTPEAVVTLQRQYGVSHLLARADKRWPFEPIFQSLNFTIYRLGPPKSAKSPV